MHKLSEKSLIDSDSDDQFLSTLSPRIKPSLKKKRTNKRPTVLSSKNYFRRFSICEKSITTIPIDSLSIIEISSTDSSSDENNENDPYRGNSEDNNSHCTPEKKHEPDFISPSPQSRDMEIKCLSTAKKGTSSILCEKLTTGFRTKLFENEKLTNSTHERFSQFSHNDTSFLQYEDFKKTENFNANSTVLAKAVEIQRNIRRIESTDEDSSENILDHLYGGSWKSKKEYVLPGSAKKKFPSKSDNMLNFEKKPIKYDSHQNCKLPEVRANTHNFIEKLQSIISEDALEILSMDKTPISREDRNENIENKSNDSETDRYSFSSGDERNLGLEERIKKKLNNKTKNRVLQEKNFNTFSTKSDIVEIEEKTKKLTINPNGGGTYQNASQNLRTNEDSSVNILNKKNEKSDKGKLNEPAPKPKRTEKKKKDKHFPDIAEYDPKNLNKKGTHSFLASLSKNIPDSECDVMAKFFKKNYEANRENLAIKLFELYNQQVFDNSIPSETSLEWNGRMLSTAGYCYSRKKIQRNGTIERSVRIVLSSKVLSSADRLRDTLIHEMCHAAAWIVNSASGHGHHWSAWTQKAGIVFPELPPIKTCHNYEIKTKYVYRCTGCGYSIKRHRKSLDIERKRCGYCHGKFEILINKTNKKGEQQTIPVGKKKEPTGFALFVKENYSAFKTPELNHGEVMKLLSKKFNELKT